MVNSISSAGVLAAIGSQGQQGAADLDAMSAAEIDGFIQSAVHQFAASTLGIAGRRATEEIRRLFH